METKATVAIQGERGSFSHAAALEALGQDIEIVPCPTFDAVFAAVESGRAARALLPIENSLTGSIHENYDRLESHRLHIVGETHLRVRQCLVARPGATLASIRRVASHPVALAQCRGFFARNPGIEPVAAYDTAGSVMDLVRGGLVSQAAIASALAAQLHGAVVLLEGIEDDPQNYTRFLALSPEPQPAAAATKTSLVFTLKNAPGALHRHLGVFAGRGVDLAKIESRPLKGRPWEYAFYLDVLGDPAGTTGEALRELQAMAAHMRVLGSYTEDRTSAAAREFRESPGEPAAARSSIS
jgi:prephenate dehydratase